MKKTDKVYLIEFGEEELNPFKDPTLFLIKMTIQNFVPLRFGGYCESEKIGIKKEGMAILDIDEKGVFIEYQLED